ASPCTQHCLRLPALCSARRPPRITAQNNHLLKLFCETPTMSVSPLSPLEEIKTSSRFLRGTIAQELENPVTGAIPESDTKLLKFHGSYMQDDRDIRDERRKQKLEPAYDFMVRARLPGGVIPPAQWLALDELATKYA